MVRRRRSWRRRPRDSPRRTFLSKNLHDLDCVDGAADDDDASRAVAMATMIESGSVYMSVVVGMRRRYGRPTDDVEAHRNASSEDRVGARSERVSGRGPRRRKARFRRSCCRRGSRSRSCLKPERLLAEEIFYGHAGRRRREVADAEPDEACCYRRRSIIDAPRRVRWPRRSDDRKLEGIARG